MIALVIAYGLFAAFLLAMFSLFYVSSKRYTNLVLRHMEKTKQDAIQWALSLPQTEPEEELE